MAEERNAEGTSAIGAAERRHLPRATSPRRRYLYVSMDRPRSLRAKLDGHRGPDTIILLGVTVAVLAAFGQIATQVIDAAVFGLRIGALDSDSHRSVFGVLSLGAQAATVVTVGVRCRSPSRRAAWLLLTGLTALLL